MVVLEVVKAVYEGGKFGYKVGQRIAVKEANRDLVNWVSQFDYVWFDFSDWSPSDLNSNTTSYVWGIPSGQLRVKADRNVFRVNCERTFFFGCTTNTVIAGIWLIITIFVATGSDIVYLYKWCRENAPGVGENQRQFRFEHGKYAGEGEIKTMYKALGVAAVTVGFLSALLSD